MTPSGYDELLSEKGSRKGAINRVVFVKKWDLLNYSPKAWDLTEYCRNVAYVSIKEGEKISWIITIE